MIIILKAKQPTPYAGPLGVFPLGLPELSITQVREASH